MKKILSALLKYAVPAVISIGLCWLLFRNFDFRQMWLIISTECDPRWYIPSLALAVGAMIFRALRWQIQLQALGIRAGWVPLVLSMFGTYAVNLVFPRLGEVWRSGYIAQRCRAPFATVFGSMVSDRLTDTVVAGLLVVITFILASGAIGAYLEAGGESMAAVRAVVASPLTWVAVGAACGAVWWLLAGKRRGGFIGRLQTFARDTWQGFAVIATMHGKGRWLIYTAAVWACYFVQMLMAFCAFGFTQQLIVDYGMTTILVTFVVSSISMVVPSNGGIGPWQWAVMFALGVYGLGATEAAAFANFTLAVNTLLIILLGLLAFITIPFERRRA